MNEFFQLWRRKIGVCTLFFACLSAAAWLRSFHVCDKVCHPTSKPSHHHWHSVGGQIWFSRLLEEKATLSCKWHSITQNTNVVICLPEQKTWQKNIGGIEIGEFSDLAIGKETYWIIPYQYIVIPLTLLSAWLLLSMNSSAINPRRAH